MSILNEKDTIEAIKITRESKPLVDEPITRVWPFLNCVSWCKWLFCKEDFAADMKVSLVSKEDE